MKELYLGRDSRQAPPPVAARVPGRTRLMQGAIDATRWMKNMGRIERLPAIVAAELRGICIRVKADKKVADAKALAEEKESKPWRFDEDTGERIDMGHRPDMVRHDFDGMMSEAEMVDIQTEFMAIARANPNVSGEDLRHLDGMLHNNRRAGDQRERTEA